MRLSSAQLAVLFYLEKHRAEAVHRWDLQQAMGRRLSYRTLYRLQRERLVVSFVGDASGVGGARWQITDAGVERMAARRSGGAR